MSPDFVSHREDANKWIKRGKGYKETVVNRIHKLPLTSVQANTDKDSEVNTDPVVPPLSMSCKDADMPEEMYEGMWIKASKLIAEGNSITDGPGSLSRKMVYSFTNPI